MINCMLQALKGGRELAREVRKWMDQDGSVLVISYNLFTTAVKQESAAEGAAVTPPRNPTVAELSRRSSMYDSPAASGDDADLFAGDADEDAIDGVHDMEEEAVPVRTPAGEREVSQQWMLAACIVKAIIVFCTLQLLTAVASLQPAVTHSRRVVLCVLFRRADSAVDVLL